MSSGILLSACFRYKIFIGARQARQVEEARRPLDRRHEHGKDHGRARRRRVEAEAAPLAAEAVVRRELRDGGERARARRRERQQAAGGEHCRTRSVLLGELQQTQLQARVVGRALVMISTDAKE